LAHLQTHWPVPRQVSIARLAGLAYGLSAAAIMWAVWATFIVMLVNAGSLRRVLAQSADWGGGLDDLLRAGLIDVALIALFGLQHSLMARPALKARWSAHMHPAFERATYVHAANAALLLLALVWQPIPIVVWHVEDEIARGVLWALFGWGWITLLAGAWCFGINDLLGVTRILDWYHGRSSEPQCLKTGGLYRWMRHPMYVGFLLGVWATPLMTADHLILAAGFTLYVLIAMRYEERDLERAYGNAYRGWRAPAPRFTPRETVR
jgi:methanethiol S-methyltransferase